MEKILNLSESEKIAKKLRAKGEKIVLTGGCFDLLHIGHLHFLEKAKMAGDVLIIALESDINVKKLKGVHRPINSQLERARLLTALSLVDYVVLLPKMSSYKDYEKLVQSLCPDAIAITTNDPQIQNKKRQAKLVGAKVKVVAPLLKNKSTSKIAQILASEL